MFYRKKGVPLSLRTPLPSFPPARKTSLRLHHWSSPQCQRHFRRRKNSSAAVVLIGGRPWRWIVWLGLLWIPFFPNLTCFRFHCNQYEYSEKPLRRTTATGAKKVCDTCRISSCPRGVLTRWLSTHCDKSVQTPVFQILWHKVRIIFEEKWGQF